MADLRKFHIHLRRITSILRLNGRLRQMNPFLYSILVTSLIFNYNYYITRSSCETETTTNFSAYSVKRKQNAQNKFHEEYLQFSVNNEKICSNISDENLLLMIVTSARHNFVLRQAIRETWGSVIQHNVIDPENGSLITWHVRLIFIVGLPVITEGPYHKRQLEQEARTFGDIIMGNFTDTYRHLSYKHLLGYKWVINYCPAAQFILKVDDDVFVNVYQVFRLINTLNRKANRCAFFCHKNVGQPAVRYKFYKTRVTIEEWPDAEFPPYCTGFGYLATTNVISKLYAQRHQVPFLYIEDVFVTGVLREAHNRKVTRDNPNYIQIRNIHWMIKMFENLKMLLAESWNSRMISLIMDREDAHRTTCKLWKLYLTEYYMSLEGKVLGVFSKHRRVMCPEIENP